MLCWRAREENPWGAVPLAAGFSGVASEPCDARLVVGGGGPDGSDRGALAEAAEFLLEVEPMAALLKDTAAEVRERARAGVLEALRPYARHGRVELGAGCWLYRAVNPAATAATPGASG